MNSSTITCFLSPRIPSIADCQLTTQAKEFSQTDCPFPLELITGLITTGYPISLAFVFNSSKLLAYEYFAVRNPSSVALFLIRSLFIVRLTALAVGITVYPLSSTSISVSVWIASTSGTM